MINLNFLMDSNGKDIFKNIKILQGQYIKIEFYKNKFIIHYISI